MILPTTVSSCLRRYSLPAVAVLATCSALAHHSPAAFDVNSRVHIRAEVVPYIWRNPHVYLYVNGTDDSGVVAEWQIEGDPTPLMTRSGWSASTLAPGDIVSLEMHPDRDPSRRHGLLAGLTKADGQTFTMRGSRRAAQQTASSIAGVWDALPRFRGTDQIYNADRAFTPAGQAARAAYTHSMFPASQCLSFPTPAITVIPYLNEIEILEDRVHIKTEFYSTDRVIYTDGRGHPDNGERTIQGHSIGHWEGTTLVVDTRLFADYRIANGPGVPSGSQKHTIERFALSEDRTELEIEIFVEDPEYVIEPYTITTTWVYTPNRSLERFSCDPESAQSFYSYE